MTETTDSPAVPVPPGDEASLRTAAPVEADATPGPQAETAEPGTVAESEATGQPPEVDGTATDEAATDEAATDEAATDEAATDPHDELVAEGDAAGDYLERLLDILDYDGDIDLDVEGERAAVSIIGQGDVEKLVGEHGEVLGALQELTRLAAGMETGQRSRLMLDIAGYRAKRRAELEELGRETAEQVVTSGSPVKLGVMNPFERKVVHDAVATVAGASSSSEGEEPHRRVVVTPAG